jgi:hypothetical protein
MLGKAHLKDSPFPPALELPLALRTSVIGACEICASVDLAARRETNKPEESVKTGSMAIDSKARSADCSFASPSAMSTIGAKTELHDGNHSYFASAVLLYGRLLGDWMAG